jgi:hypothetical protein
MENFLHFLMFMKEKRAQEKQSMGYKDGEGRKLV